MCASETPAERMNRFREDLGRVRESIARVIVGQRELVDGVLVCLFAGGHVLLEGVPGLGKTRLVRVLASTLDLDFARIQFTPDLMPSDIVGTNVLSESRAGASIEFRKGPVFANVVLADEINRATPKTQSALLEAMQEHAVTVSGTTHRLSEPYIVLATQNPLEMEGTYPLPEAQLDRFLFKLLVPFPSREDLHAILDRTTGRDEPEPVKVLDRTRLLAMRAAVREVEIAHPVKDYAIRILEATHPDRPSAPDAVKRFVRFGASPRGAQSILLAAKVRALTDGRFAVAHEDVRWATKPALRHRILLNFEGEAEGVDRDRVLDELVGLVPEATK